MSEEEDKPLAESLMEANDTFMTFAEQAKGFQSKLEESGWAHEAAEKHASELLSGFISHAFVTLNAGAMAQAQAEAQVSAVKRGFFGR